VTKKKTAKKKTTKKKNPVGAPTLYKPEYCDLLIQHMAKGFSFESFGAEVNCGGTTVANWLKHSEFRAAKQKAQVLNRKFWEDLGIKGTRGEIKGFNVASWVFNMKNRFHWRNEVVVKDERKVESVTIELPSAKKAETITLNDGDWRDNSK